MTQQPVSASPPHSIETEQALLGASLLNDAALDAVGSVVSVDKSGIAP
jgi:replicative DNA helicase